MMDAPALAERLTAGGEVADVGQLDAEATRFLRREVAAKRAELFVCHEFPKRGPGRVSVGVRPVEAATFSTTEGGTT